jgi:hypothetical protein
MPHNPDDLYAILSDIDSLADNAVALVKPFPEQSAEIAIDLALDRFGSTWAGDKAELAARRQWLRSEILRRMPKVGRA